MRAPIRAAVLAAAVVSMASMGTGVAMAAPAPAPATAPAAAAGDAEAYVVPTDEVATATEWTAERMLAAIPGEVLVEDSVAVVDPAAVAAGEPTTYAAPAAAVTPVSSAVRVTPVSHIGKVFFSFGADDYVCSANAVVSVNESTVSTAGHCLSGLGDFADSFIFVPAYEDGRAPYGQWPATELVTTEQWASSEDINYDVGFAVVGTRSGQTLTDTVGASGVTFNQPLGLSYSLYGYPAAPPFDGQSLQMCAGTATPDRIGFNDSQGVPCDMTGGSSGGPWFIGSGSGGLQNSVNSYGYDGQRVPTMYGPYFGSVVQSAYQDAQA